MSVTRRLGQFVAGTSPGAITPEARLQARRAVLDTLGVTLAGSREKASRIVAGERVEKAIEAVQALEEMPDVRELVELRSA